MRTRSFGPVGPLVRRERLLRRDGRGDRVARPTEAVEERVTLGVDLLSPACAKRLANDAAVVCERIRVPVAEPLQQLRGARDVREDEGDRPALEAGHALSRSGSSACVRRRRTRGFASLTISSR